MTAEIAVLIGAVVLIALLTWYFFGPKAAHAATVRGGVQEVDILVKGGCSPDLVRVQAGMPVRLVFDRQDNSGCTERVVFPDLSLGKSLAAFAKTAVEFTPGEPGEYGWACGMNMLHGKVIVEPAGSTSALGGESSGAFAAAVGVGRLSRWRSRPAPTSRSSAVFPASPHGSPTSRPGYGATPASSASTSTRAPDASASPTSHFRGQRPGSRHIVVHVGAPLPHSTSPRTSNPCLA